jgi:hypothetical protein
MFGWLLPDESLATPRERKQENPGVVNLIFRKLEEKDGCVEASIRAYHSGERLARHEGH